MRDLMALVLCAVCLAGGFAGGLWLAGASQEVVEQDVVYQVSTIDALLQGSYEGVCRLER